MGLGGRGRGAPELHLRLGQRLLLVESDLLLQPRAQLRVEELREELRHFALGAHKFDFGGRLRVEELLDGLPDAVKDGAVVEADDEAQSLRVVVGQHVRHAVTQLRVARAQRHACKQSVSRRCSDKRIV